MRNNQMTNVEKGKRDVKPVKTTNVPCSVFRVLCLMVEEFEEFEEFGGFRVIYFVIKSN